MKGICPECDDKGCEECTGKEKEMNETTFENAKVGDRAWDAAYGPMTICEMGTDSLIAKTDAGERFQFNVGGHIFIGMDTRACIIFYAPNRTLFWSEVQITPPPRPKRMKKVEIVRYVNAYKNHRNPDDYILEYSITKDEAEECAEKYAIAIAVPVTIPFEVEE